MLEKDAPSFLDVARDALRPERLPERGYLSGKTRRQAEYRSSQD